MCLGLSHLEPVTNLALSFVNLNNKIMCFTINPLIMAEPQIAKRDIVAYKTVRFKSNFKRIGSFFSFRSPIKLFEYLPFVLYKTDLEIREEPVVTQVNFKRTKTEYVTKNVFAGFHCYRKLVKAKRRRGGSESVVKMIIPKGAHYIVNETEIVSDKIMLVEEVQRSTWGDNY
jgi:hypothetical protein